MRTKMTIDLNKNAFNFLILFQADLQQSIYLRKMRDMSGCVKCGLYTVRVVMFFVVLALLGGGGAAIYYAIDFSTSVSSNFIISM